MAVVIEKDSAVIENAGAFDPDGAGTNRAVIACALMSDNSADGTLDTHDLASTDFTNGDLHSLGTSSPFAKAAHGYMKDGVAPLSDSTYNLAISTSFLNSGTYIAECSNVDQTTPVSEDELQKGGSAFGTHTVTCLSGDLVIFVATCTTVNTITAPGSLGGVDAWTLQFENTAGLIGGGLDNGSVFTVIASQGHTNVSVVATVDGGNVHAWSYHVVVAASSAVADLIPPPLLHSFAVTRATNY